MPRPPVWTIEHESLVRLADELEAAGRINRAAAEAREVLHSGDLGIVQTERDFEVEQKRAEEEGRPIDPRFRGWLLWTRTADDLHRALAAMYPPEDKARINELAHGDMRAVPWALVFLEADPRCFRAGYVRERLLRYLARMLDQLSNEELHRLRFIALGAVDDPWRPSGADRYARVPAVQAMRAKLGPAANAAHDEYMRRRLPDVQRREFKWYCRLAARLADPALRRELAARAASSDTVVAGRAQLMLGAMDHRQRPASQAETAT